MSEDLTSWETIASSLTAVATTLAGVFGWNKYKDRKQEPEPEKAASHTTGAHTVRLETARERQVEIQNWIKALTVKIDALEQEVARLSAYEERVSTLVEVIRETSTAVTNMKADIAVLKDRTRRE